MLNFDTKITHQSEAFPGVAFIVRRLNQIQRAKRDLSIVEHRRAFSDLHARFQKLVEEVKALRDAGSADAATATEKTALDIDLEAGRLLDIHIKPAVIRSGLLSISGLSLDGQEATIAAITDHAPDALIDEIYVACELASGLTADQQKNSQSPSDSLGLAAGEKSSTTVNGAPGLEITAGVGAESRTQP